MSHKSFISQRCTCTNQHLRTEEIHKSWEFPLTLPRLSQVSARPPYGIYFLAIITTWSWIIKEPVCCPSKSHPISLCKQTCHNNMAGCWVHHDIIYLEGFAHNNWATNEVSQRLEVRENATHVPPPRCWRCFDPSTGRLDRGCPFEC